MKRLMIRKGENCYAADDMDFIIYGCGDNLMRMFERIEIPNIRYFIDEKAKHKFNEKYGK